MYENIAAFISAITVILGVFGLILLFKLLSVWNKIDSNLMKARVFLADKFVIKNLIIIFIVGLLIALHNFIEYLGMSYPKSYNYVSAIFPIRLFAVTELLVALLLL